MIHTLVTLVFSAKGSKSPKENILPYELTLILEDYGNHPELTIRIRTNGTSHLLVLATTCSS